MPLPCAHPNCHSLTYAFRSGGRVVPLPRFIDARNHLEILANGILFTRNRAKQLIDQYLAQGRRLRRRGVRLPRMGTEWRWALGRSRHGWRLFFARALAEELAQSDVFRITITSFLDAYNFDVRRLMKCCIHHVLPSGHVIPFCAYNVLYREGHVVLPALRDAGVVDEPEKTRTGALVELTA